MNGEPGDPGTAPRRAPLPARLPPHIPQFADRAWRKLFRALVRADGWRLEGELPDIPRAVLIVAPHSSWWDGIHGLVFKLALGIDISFMAKRELFAGPLGWMLRRLGGIPIPRHAAHGVVEQMRARFRERERLWLGIEPEGTRKRVAEWKSGFWRIARDAGVPIVPVYFDYPRKVIGLGAPFATTSDMRADIAALRAFYAPFRGRHRGVLGTRAGTTTGPPPCRAGPSPAPTAPHACARGSRSGAAGSARAGCARPGVHGRPASGTARRRSKYRSPSPRTT